MLRALGLARARFAIQTCFEKPANALREPHDQSFAIRHHREGVALARRGASARAIPDRLVDAGHSSGHETRRRHDVPRLLRYRHPDPYRFALGLAPPAYCCAPDVSSPIAT